MQYIGYDPGPAFEFRKRRLQGRKIRSDLVKKVDRFVEQVSESGSSERLVEKEGIVANKVGQHITRSLAVRRVIILSLAVRRIVCTVAGEAIGERIADAVTGVACQTSQQRSEVRHDLVRTLLMLHLVRTLLM